MNIHPSLVSLPLLLALSSACSSAAPGVGTDDTDSATSDPACGACPTEAGASDAGSKHDTGSSDAAASTSNDGGAQDGASGPCMGSATSNGMVPAVHAGAVFHDTSTVMIDFQFSPNDTISPGDDLIGLYVVPKQGQLSYANSPAGGCAIFVANGNNTASVIDQTKTCDVEFSTLQLASAPGTCDGRAVGTFSGVFTGNDSVAGTFDVPLDISWYDLTPPVCLNPENVCASNAQCCSGNCSTYLGTCF